MNNFNLFLDLGSSLFCDTSSCPQLDLLLMKANRFAFILLNCLNLLLKSQDKSLTAVSLNFS